MGEIHLGLRRAAHADVPRTTAEYDQVLIQPPEGGLSSPSVTLPDWIRAIDRARLVEHLGDLSPETLAKVDHSLRVVLGL